MTKRPGSQIRSSICAALTAAIALSGLTLSAPSAGAAPKGRLPTVSPTPQLMETIPGLPVAVSRAHVRIVSDAGTDAITISIVKQTLEDAGAASITTSQAGKAPSRLRGTVVRIGTLTSSDITRTLAQWRIDGRPADRAEGYVIGSRGGPSPRIVLAGADDDGTFYAAKTLEQLVQKRGRTSQVPALKVVDHPSMALRGSIEGFYGEPWTQADRLDQLRFYGDTKLNTYIYAPKDDPYHRNRWREPYPAEASKDLAALAAEATRNHVKFTFALSPGYDEAGVATKICFTSDSDWKALTDKLQAVYDMGVRVFHIPFDDISLNSWSCQSDKGKYGAADSQANQAHAQADLLNRLQKEFIDTHKGARPLQMTPTHYEGVEDTVYRQTLRAQLNQGIEVMWTGMATVPPSVTVSDASRIAEVYGRKAFLWDNYPTNDFGTAGRLHLGTYQYRDAGLSQYLSGLVLNPMNQAAASKVVLFEGADFAWNGSAYDPDRSARQSASYLARGDRRTTEALLTFFDLNHYAPTFGDDPWLEQSPELASQFKDFWELWDAGKKAQALHELDRIATTLRTTPDAMRSGVKDPLFQNDVARHLKALDLWSDSLDSTVAALKASAGGDADRATELAAQAKARATKAGQVPSDPRTRPKGHVLLADGVLDTFIAAAGRRVNP